LSQNANAASILGKLGAVLFAASHKTKWNPEQTASAPNVVIADKSEVVLGLALDEKLQINIRASAIELLSGTADRETLPKLLPLLSNKTLVGNYLLDPSDDQASVRNDQKRSLLGVQIRDLALATSIILNGNSPAEFGFSPQCFAEGKLVMNQAGFVTDQERNEAFSAWEKHNLSEKDN